MENLEIEPAAGRKQLSLFSDFKGKTAMLVLLGVNMVNKIKWHTDFKRNYPLKSCNFCQIQWHTDSIWRCWPSDTRYLVQKNQHWKTVKSGPKRESHFCKNKREITKLSEKNCKNKREMLRIWDFERWGRVILTLRYFENRICFIENI